MTTKYVLRKQFGEGEKARWGLSQTADTFAEIKHMGQKLKLDEKGGCTNWQIVQRTIDEAEFLVEDEIVYDYKKEARGGMFYNV